MADGWVAWVNNLLPLGLAGFSDYFVQYLKHTTWIPYVSWLYRPQSQTSGFFPGYSIKGELVMKIMMVSAYL
ncbi:MAG: hypothetical protein KJP05_05650 [Deltaproteobacteria bacterium]|nr:hypothetical protein [Deltaproteobacteria bacterium]